MNETIHSFMWKRIQQDNEIRNTAAKKSCEMGNPHGQYQMATRYRHGWGVEINCDKSIELYKKAAENGHAGACYELARLYLQGNVVMGFGQDVSKAKLYANLGTDAAEEKYSCEGYDQKHYINESQKLFVLINNIFPPMSSSYKI